MKKTTPLVLRLRQLATKQKKNEGSNLLEKIG